MELFQVRYFLALAKTLNFTRAAETCHVSQPALTRAIQRLEEELGGPLLHRERNQTQLTSLGRAMVTHLEAAYAAAETAASQAAAFRRRETSPVRIGIADGLSPLLLTPVLSELTARFKGFEFSLEEGGAEDLAEQMLADRLDTALLAERDGLPERLNRWPLFEDGYGLLCPPGHPLAKLKEVPPAALAEQPVLIPAAAGATARHALERLTAAAGIALALRQQGATFEAVQQLVGAGLGIALWPLHRVPPPGLLALPFAEAGSRYRVLLAAVAGRQHGPGLASFLKLMRARDWTASLAALQPAHGIHSRTELDRQQAE
jgi:LysR family hydrogen peroxide-inducible transcriptional activator